MPKEPTKKERDDMDVQVSIETPEPADIANAPLTVGNLFKWFSITFTIVSVVISGVWFVASTKSDNLLMKQQIDALKDKIAETNQLSIARNDAQEKEITDLTNRTNQTEKSVQEMARKLDVAVALLERIDQKVGKP